MRAEAERLVRDTEMPSLSELSQAVLLSRKRYANKIRRASQEVYWQLKGGHRGKTN